MLAGLPVTPMRTSSAATVVEGLALRGEDRAVGREQVAALHARAARARADEQGEVDAVEDLARRRAPISTPARLRERAVVELHDDALERLEGGLDLEQSQLDRAVAEQRAAGEAEEQAVADLAGGAGDGDLQGSGSSRWTPVGEVEGGWSASDASSATRCRPGGLLAFCPMPRPVPAVRRPVRIAVPALLGRGAGAASGCGAAEPRSIDPPAWTGSRSRRRRPTRPTSWTRIDNPYLPLAPGSAGLRRDRGRRGRPRRSTVTRHRRHGDVAGVDHHRGPRRGHGRRRGRHRGHLRLVRPGRAPATSGTSARTPRRTTTARDARRVPGRPASTAPRPGWRCRHARASATATSRSTSPASPRTARRCCALDASTSGRVRRRRWSRPRHHAAGAGRRGAQVLRRRSRPRPRGGARPTTVTLVELGAGWRQSGRRTWVRPSSSSSSIGPPA